MQRRGPESYIDLTVNPSLGAVLVRSLGIRVLPGSFMYVNTVCPAENRLVASSLTEWRPSCPQTHVEGLFYVKCAEGDRERTGPGVPLRRRGLNTQWTPGPGFLTSCGTVAWPRGTSGSPASVSVPSFGLRESSSSDLLLPPSSGEQTSIGVQPLGETWKTCPGFNDISMAGHRPHPSPLNIKSPP